MKPRLWYFDLRGRAEAIRLTLHAAGIAFDDRRVEDADEWAALQPKVPFGRLPTFDTESGTVCESQAILRHIDRAFVGAQRSEAERLRLEQTVEVVAE